MTLNKFQPWINKENPWKCEENFPKEDLNMRMFNQTADFLSTVTASSEYFPLILEAQNVCANGYKDAQLIDVNDKNEYIWKYEEFTFTYFEMFNTLSNDPYKLSK